MRAWYFAPKGNRLRYGDGRLIRVGVTHRVDVSPVLCVRGLHASERVLDALSYADSSILYRVELSGEVDVGDDKVAAQCRRYLKRYDVEKVLRKFARRQALINIELTRPYCSDLDFNIIVDYLNTGSKNLRSAAESAARSAAWSAARSAAESAARSAAESAAWSAAWSAAESAARSAANDMLTQMIVGEFGDEYL